LDTPHTTRYDTIRYDTIRYDAPSDDILYFHLLFLLQAIACRQDLEPILESRYPFGALDGKVTSARLLMGAKAFEEKERRSIGTEEYVSASPTVTRSLRAGIEYVQGVFSTNSNININSNIKANRLLDRSQVGQRKDHTVSQLELKVETEVEAGLKVEPDQSRQQARPKRASFRPPHAYARMGPSNSADKMPPFCWKAFSRNRDKRGKVFSHQGQPDCFDFAWTAMPPPLYLSDD
jgi:hypothetical protein